MADIKITALSEATTTSATDLAVIVSDPSGVATTKKVQLSNLIPDGTIDADALGDGIPILPYRVGGDATDWDDDGNTEYATGKVKMYAGIVKVFIPIGGSQGDYHIEFPSAFSAPPLVFTSVVWADYMGTKPPTSGETADGYYPNLKGYIFAGRPEGQATTATYEVYVRWLAIGPDD